MTDPDDRTVYLRRNAERGWIDLILAAPSADEADRQLGAESEALKRLLEQDMTLHEALEVQRLATELDALRCDLRRSINLRRSPPPEGPDEPAEGDPDEPPDEREECLRDD